MGSTGRRRRQARHQYSDWQEPPKHVQQWRSTSPTVRYLRENASKIKGSLNAVRRGLDTARYSALSSGKDAKLKIVTYLKAVQSLDRRQGGALLSGASQDSEEMTDLQKVLKKLISKRDSQSFTAGVLCFGGLLFLSGAQPWALPYIYLLFAAISLPLRILDFVRRKWVYFLLDFCYIANLAVICFLVFAPSNPKYFMAVYALADGPLAAALIVWQTAWVFGSTAHTISVLIHQLPGLALFALKYYPPPAAMAMNLPLSSSLRDTRRRFNFDETGLSLKWSILAPLLFYLLWQLSYFVIVQVISRSFIKANGYDTSYSCLARRAVKSNNFWNRTVRKGSALRRVTMFGKVQLLANQPRVIGDIFKADREPTANYVPRHVYQTASVQSIVYQPQPSLTFGLIQALYTVCVVLFFAPISKSFWLSFLWQVVKIAYPIWHGARHICEKVPRHAVMEVWKQQQLQQ